MEPISNEVRERLESYFDENTVRRTDFEKRLTEREIAFILEKVETDIALIIQKAFSKRNHVGKWQGRISREAAREIIAYLDPSPLSNV